MRKDLKGMRKLVPQMYGLGGSHPSQRDQPLKNLGNGHAWYVPERTRRPECLEQNELGREYEEREIMGPES